MMNTILYDVSFDYHEILLNYKEMRNLGKVTRLLCAIDVHPEVLNI